MTTVTRHLDVAGLGDPRRFGYAHAVRCGPLIFLAGQMGIDADYQVVSESFDEQARTTLANVRRALVSCHAEVGDLVSMTVYLTDMRNSGRFFEIRTEEFGETLVASTTVAVSQLPLPGLQVEVQAIAAAPDR